MNPGFQKVPEPGLTCEEIRDLLHCFVSNELEGEELKAVLEHLAACEGCRAAMAEHVRLIGKMRENMPKLGKLYFRVSQRRYD